MHNVVVTSDLWVLTLKGVQAVRAGDNNLGRLYFIQHFNILLCLHLVKEFVTGTASRVTGARLAIAKDHEFHTSGVKEFGHGLGCCLGTILKCTGATHPKKIINVCRNYIFAVATKDSNIEINIGDPGIAVSSIHAPRIAFGLNIFKHAIELSREVGGDHDLVATHVSNVINVLNVNGTLIHASATHGAGPEDIIGNNRKLK